MEQASPADAIESRAAEQEHAREPAPAHEPRGERTEAPQPAREPTVQSFGTPVATSLGTTPVAFKAVIQHDESADDEQHRPNRRRRSASDSQTQQELQLVETQADAPVIAVAEDELPRRTKPRRRRGGPIEAEPLQLVETQGGAEQRPEGSPPL